MFPVHTFAKCGKCGGALPCFSIEWSNLPDAEKCRCGARRPCSTCGKPNDNINPRNPLCESCDTIQDLNDD